MESIHDTIWAKEIKEYCKDQYDVFINVASDPELMVNVYNVDNVGWVIEARNILQDFWLDVKYTKQQAYDLCNTMGWSIR